VLSALRPAGQEHLYYGWKVLAALFMAGFMVYGGGLWSFVLFVLPLTQEFHWNRAATGGLVTAFWLSAPLILLGGYGIDVDDVRLLIRPSGTEPVVRVMIESLDEAFVNEFSQQVQNFFLV